MRTPLIAWPKIDYQHRVLGAVNEVLHLTLQSNERGLTRPDDVHAILYTLSV